MSFESHPAAAEPTQDETTGTGLDLTPALLEVQRAFESQIRQILESTQGVKSSFETDVGKLDKCALLPYQVTATSHRPRPGTPQDDHGRKGAALRQHVQDAGRKESSRELQ